MTLVCLIIGTPGDGGEAAMTLVTSVKAGSHPTAWARSCYMGPTTEGWGNIERGPSVFVDASRFVGIRGLPTPGVAPKAPIAGERGRGDISKVFDAMKGHTERARVGGGWARFAVQFTAGGRRS